MQTLPWDELDRHLHAAQQILLTTHVRPDGDALGSELGMADLLLSRGKSVEILNASPTPSRYRFLDPHAQRIACIDPADPRPAREPDLCLILDTGTWSQLAGLAPYIRSFTGPKIVMDHHQSQDDLNALRLVDTAAAATGMLVYDAYHALGGVFSPASAQALYVAIAMDTGWMRHPNSSPDVFLAMARLVAEGAQPHAIYRELFEQDRPERLRLMAVLFEHLEVRAGGRLATSYLSWQDIIDVQAHPMETEDFINELMRLAGVEVAALFLGQVGGGTKVSLRSRNNFDCSRFSESLGGGGHKAAAGASCSDPVDIVRARVLASLDTLLATENS